MTMYVLIENELEGCEAAVKWGFEIGELGLGTTPTGKEFAALVFSIFDLVSPEAFDRQPGKQPYSFRSCLGAS